MPVDTDDRFDMRGDRSQVVRHHNDCHPVVELPQNCVQLLFKFIVHEICRLVEDQHFRVGDQRTAKQRTLQLAARELSDRAPGDRLDTAQVKQLQSFGFIGCGVTAKQPFTGLQPGKHHFTDRYWKGFVYVGYLWQVADSPVTVATDHW